MMQEWTLNINNSLDEISFKKLFSIVKISNDNNDHVFVQFNGKSVRANNVFELINIFLGFETSNLKKTNELVFKFEKKETFDKIRELFVLI